jgi:Fuc2NAc and GlcNAc transferase
MALLFGGAAVALLGWLDDHRPLGVAARMVVQLATAAGALVAFGAIESVETGFGRLQFGWMVGSALAVLGIVWLTNLYNFLDGTDGYAATEAICAGLAGAALLLRTGDPGLAMLCALIAAASAGFLVWNWSPARVFMGDVGSYFLGYTFGVLALWGEKSGTVHAYVWLILLGVFVWDATLTLIRRVFARERWFAAHRTHAYQRLHQLGVSHSRLALLLLAVNVLLLWPLAYVAAVWNNRAMWAVLASAGPLIAAWWFIQARFERRHSGIPE